MKPSYEWGEKDILELIKSKEKESLIMEYKGSGSLANTNHKKKEISKDVSSFANSAEGIIIYGIVEKDNFPDGIDKGYDPNEITKEWIEQVINSRIHRRI